LIRAHEREDLYRQQGDTYREEWSMIIKYSITENKDINILKWLSWNQRSMSWSRSDFYFWSEYISIWFITSWYWRPTLTIKQITEKIQYIISQIKSEVSYINNSLEREYKNLERDIRDTINQRISKIKEDETLLSELQTASPIPIRIKKSWEVGYHANLKKRSFIKCITKPISNWVNDLSYPVLDPKIYNDILQYIENLWRQFEKTPNSYSWLGEEHIRDLILVSLNWIFENNATGETFAKKWKTDIYLVIDKWNILKFECKYRKWRSIVHPTINQLLNYTTWRDNYWSIILFIKAKWRTAILKKVYNELESYPTLVWSICTINSSHFQCKIENPDDDEKLLNLSCLCFFLGWE
jgi:hypothetical protein